MELDASRRDKRTPVIRWIMIATVGILTIAIIESQGPPRRPKLHVAVAGIPSDAHAVKARLQSYTRQVLPLDPYVEFELPENLTGTQKIQVDALRYDDVVLAHGEAEFVVSPEPKGLTVTMQPVDRSLLPSQSRRSSTQYRPELLLIESDLPTPAPRPQQQARRLLLSTEEISRSTFSQLVSTAHRPGQSESESIFAYCNELSKKEELQPCYEAGGATAGIGCQGYRLPTAAEWDFTKSAGMIKPSLFQKIAVGVLVEDGGSLWTRIVTREGDGEDAGFVAFRVARTLSR